MMDYGINMARETMSKNWGGPFGAVIVRDGEIVCVASNTVLKDNDVTAHAEMNAIRQACQILGTYDLKGCSIYATGYPCPMCLSAIMWANIREVYYGADCKDVRKIGFRDDHIYQFIRNNNQGNDLKISQVGLDECVKLLDEYEKMSKIIY